MTSYKGPHLLPTVHAIYLKRTCMYQQYIPTGSNPLTNVFGMHILTIFKLSWLAYSYLNKVFCICVYVHTCTYCILQTSTGEVLYQQHSPNQPVFIDMSISALHSIHSSVRYKMLEIAHSFYLTHYVCVFNPFYF